MWKALPRSDTVRRPPPGGATPAPAPDRPGVEGAQLAAAAEPRCAATAPNEAACGMAAAGRKGPPEATEEAPPCEGGSEPEAWSCSAELETDEKESLRLGSGGMKDGICGSGSEWD